MSRGGEGRGEHTRQGNSEFVSWEIPNADYANEKKKSLRVRYVYSIIFLVTNLIAWFLRDYGQRIVPQLHYLKSCGAGGEECFHALGVLRVSLGCFIFFFLMFLSTSRTRKLHEPRNLWHSSWWSLKFIVFIVSMLAPFFFPPALIQLYGEFARAGAGIFLILQLISVIQFISWWNKYWMPDEKMKQSFLLWNWLNVLLIRSKNEMCSQYILHLLDFDFAHCDDGCIFTFKVRLIEVCCHPVSWLRTLSSSAGLPLEVNLQPKSAAHGRKRVGIMTGLQYFFLIAICAVVMATFSTGIDSQSFQFRKDEVKEEDDIPYKYGFFHLTFSLGAMYFAMLFISWNLNNSATKWSMDVGWTSTWVKIINEWFAATIYLWTLMSPVVRKAKVRDNEEGAVVQEANDSAIP